MVGEDGLGRKRGILQQREDALPQAAGIGNRGVQIKPGAGDAERRQFVAGKADGAVRLVNQPVAAVQPRQVAHRAVHAQNQRGAGQRDFQRDNQVEPVDQQRFSGKVSAALPPPAPEQAPAGTGRARQRHPLPGAELKAVAHEGHRALQGIPAADQIKDVPLCPPQEGKGFFPEFPRVPRRIPAPDRLRHTAPSLRQKRPQKRPSANRFDYSSSGRPRKGAAHPPGIFPADELKIRSVRLTIGKIREGRLRSSI